MRRVLNGDNHHADNQSYHNEHRYSWSFYPVGEKVHIWIIIMVIEGM